MDIKALREIQRSERNSPYLQNIGEEFYAAVGKYVKELLSKIDRSKSGETSSLAVLLDEFENIKAVINDIYEMREKKIVGSALYYVKSRDATSANNLTAEENSMLKKIIEILEQERLSILKKAIPTSTDSNPQEGKPKNVTIRMLKDVPSIVGVDGKVYGAFKKEDVVTMPDANAEVFIKQGAAEKIEINSMSDTQAQRKI